MTAPGSKNVRQLPTDDAEFDRVIRRYSIFTKPLMSGVNRCCKMAKVEVLDADERESGEEVFAALFYQYQAELDARLLVVLWLVSCALPRLLEFLEKKSEEKKKAAQAAAVPALPPEAKAA